MATLAVPNTISNGQSLDASKVEANFTEVETFVNANCVQADGTTAMTAALSLVAASPTTDNHAARKKYVDDKVWGAGSLASDSVTAAKIAADSVTTVKILDANVTGAKIAADTITTANIAAGRFGDITGTALSELVGTIQPTGSQSIPNNTYTAVEFDQTDISDPSAMHNPSSNASRVTIATAGLYHFSATVIFNGNATGMRIARLIRYNSGGVAQDYFGSSTEEVDSTELCHLNVSGTTLAAAGDYIVVEAYQDSGGALTIVDTFGVTSRMSWHCLRIT